MAILVPKENKGGWNCFSEAIIGFAEAGYDRKREMSKPMVIPPVNKVVSVTGGGAKGGEPFWLKKKRF